MGIKEVNTMTDTQEREVVSGHYKVTSHWYKVILIEGVKGTAKGTVIGDFPVSISYGLFGDCEQVVGEKTGEVVNNIELSVTNQGHTMKERLSQRHEDQLPLEWMETVYKICEPAEDDEENVLTLKISPALEYQTSRTSTEYESRQAKQR